MCGIVGLINSKNRISTDKISRALNLLNHRGPDHSDYWISNDKTAAIGHTRLSIMDPHFGDQPFISSDGTLVCAVNGEFYDFKNIKSDLQKKGYRFYTNSDSEILLPLYSEYGIECLKYLRGEFAFLIYDSNCNRLIAGRDRFGIKPLYYSICPDGILFASEAKALFQLGHAPKWDSSAVFENDHFFLLQQDKTLFSGVNQVKPGHYILYEGSTILSKQYWDINFPNSDQSKSTLPEEHYSKELERLLHESVKMRLVADVPIATYLSGGLDSASILGIAAKYTNKLESFVVSFDDRDFDEYENALKIANHNNVKLRKLSITTDMIADNFESSIYHSEMTSFNSHNVAKFLLSKMVSESGYKVVLTGEGADDIFGGYAFFVRDMIAASHNDIDSKAKMMGFMNDTNRVYGTFFNSATLNECADVSDLLKFMPHFVLSGQKFMQAVQQHYSDTYTTHNRFLPPITQLLQTIANPNFPNFHPLHQTIYLWLKCHFPVYILNQMGDRMEMAHSIEARLPFLDHKLVEYASSIPAELLIKGVREKYILRKAVKNSIPDFVFQQQKHPFVAPPVCFKSDSRMHQFVSDIIYSTALDTIPFYDASSIRRFYQSTQNMTYEEQINAEKFIFMVISMCVLQSKFNLT